MKRKMIGAAAAYMSGLFFASFFTEGSDLLLLAGLFPMFFILTKLIKLPFKDSLLVTILFTIAVFEGFSYNHFVYEKIKAYSSSTGNFCGKVIEVNYYNEDKASYILDGQINGNQKARISVYTDSFDVSYGDIIALENCKFEVPKSDYLFDSESYYKARRIYLTAENPEKISVEQRDSYKLKRALESYREKIISEFRIKMGDNTGSLLGGIVFGETGNIGENSKTLLYRCGIGHVMAVSGLHVSIAAALLMFVFDKLRVNKYASFAIMNVFIILMIIMVKSPFSAIRAAIMIDFIYSARLFRRQNDTFNSLSIAVLLICLFNPYAIIDRGFLLSIAGTFGIGVFAPYMTKNMKSSSLAQKFIKNITAMLCVTLIVMPLSMLYFDEVSIISPLANVVIIPLCIAAMIIGMLYVISGGIISLLSVSELLLDIVLFITEKLGKLNFTHFSCGSRNLFLISMLCAAFVVLVQAVLKSRKFTALSIVGALAIFIFSSSLYSRNEYNKFKIAVLGRNSNAVVAIMYRGQTDIIDLSGHFKSAEYVRKYLISNGVSEIQTLSLTTKAQSQYSAYSEALNLIDIDKLMISGDTGLFESESNDIFEYGDNSFTVKNNLYSIQYSNNSVSVTYMDTTINIRPAKSELYTDSDFTIHYGKVPKNAEANCDGSNIYLDSLEDTVYNYSDMNNFEIIILDDGGCSIRRL